MEARECYVFTAMCEFNSRGGWARAKLYDLSPPAPPQHLAYPHPPPPPPRTAPASLPTGTPSGMQPTVFWLV